ncbi:hypothetical protein [Corynebacterium gallinarum]|uniref:Uncharacterized protein n=1 Tax=Corynebacterium gallinarum TaxID=2762214 RepID=A0A8I0HMX8_9CORY|nr:hypothetical protein [Corynebacterium gallinarum]MBD8030282.1 hypothetical protein [Corynebacterium gallinarum]
MSKKLQDGLTALIRSKAIEDNPAPKSHKFATKAEFRAARAAWQAENAKKTPKPLPHGLYAEYPAKASPHLPEIAPGWGRSLLAGYLRALDGANAWVVNPTVEGNAYVATPTTLTETDSAELEQLKGYGFRVLITFTDSPRITITEPQEEI